ncbi:Nuclear pore complex protein, partial [Globisporangium splendens]
MATRDDSTTQRLIEGADETLDFLVNSIPDFQDTQTSRFALSGARATNRSSVNAVYSGSESSSAMSSDTFYFNSSAASSAVSQSVFSSARGIDTAPPSGSLSNFDDAQEETTDDALMPSCVVDLSVRKGFLHVKGVFPDHSVEYIDIDPRFMTIGELKRAFCAKRETHKDLGFGAQDAKIMFDGQLVEDDWLVVDCGMGLDGVIHIVKAFTSGFLSGARTDHLELRANAQPVDPKLPISSIASAYARQNGLNDALMLSLVTPSQLSTSQAETLSRHVRPEEANFAEIASDFYEHLENVQNTDLYCENLLKGYIDVLQTRLEHLEATAQGKYAGTRQRLREDIQELRDERNTWRLLYELRQICHTDDAEDENDDNPMLSAEGDEELHFDMLEDDAIRLLETRNENFKIQSVVKSWLETIALEKTVAISEKRGMSGSRTLKLMKKNLINKEEVVHLDPDAVLREGDEFILEDDAEDEAELMKSVWLFIRAGKISDAVDLCIRLGQAWRAASLSGGTPLGVSESSERKDMALDRWGNPFRAFWKTTCWKFSEHKDVNLTKGSSLLAREYEEIIYAALSGNVEVITKSRLCETWEDHIWAYLRAVTEQQQDEILYKLLKVKTQSSQLIVGNNAHYLRHYMNLLEKTKHLKRYQANLDTLFEELKGSRIESVRAQANQPHRHIQAKLVTAKVEYIVSNILDIMLFNPDDDSYSWDLQLNSRVQADDLSPLFLRFAAHFILFSSFTGEKFDEQAGHMILKLYIRHLVKHRQLQLVPVYASRLPYPGAVEIYVQVLATVEDTLEREMVVKRILQYSDMEVLSTVLQIAVDRMCEEYRQTVEDQKQASFASTSVATSAIDMRRMRTIEYLCFYNEHRAEALCRANILARQFVKEGKFSALHQLFAEIVPEDSIGIIDLHRGIQTKGDHEIDLCIRELLCWKAYIRACTHYDSWRNCVGNAVSWTLYSEEKEFLPELMYHVSRATTGLLEALHFENGWLMQCSEVEDDDAVIRQLCLPLLVFNLHYMQLESARIIMRLSFYPEDAKLQLARPLMEKSLEVADVVADEHYGVYNALSQNECRDFLHGIRESSIALVYTEPSPSSSLMTEDAC